MSVVVKCVCKNCGAVNEIVAGSLSSDENWLGCVLPEGFEWSLPAGKLTPVVGKPIYVSASGEKLSYEDYMDRYDIDPEIAYQRMRPNPKKPVHLGGR